MDDAGVVERAEAFVRADWRDIRARSFETAVAALEAAHAHVVDVEQLFESFALEDEAVEARRFAARLRSSTSELGQMARELRAHEHDR